jgi:ADP-ribose pyrophosphatase YjhB (NUDIX family)
LHSSHATDDRFCSRCGVPLVERLVEGRARRACPSCHHVVYVHPTIGAAAAVVERGRVLLVRRRIEPFRGHWTLPAGYTELDEEPWETAERETREETGIAIARVELLDVVTNRDDHRRHGVVVAYLARPVGGALQAGDDVEAADWYGLDRLPNDLGFANNRLLLEELVRRGSAGRLP